MYVSEKPRLPELKPFFTIWAIIIMNKPAKVCDLLLTLRIAIVVVLPGTDGDTIWAFVATYYGRIVGVVTPVIKETRQYLRRRHS